MSVVAVVSLCVGRQCCVLVRRSSVWRVCQRIYYDDCLRRDDGLARDWAF